MVISRMQLSKWLVLMISIINTISDGRAQARIGFDKPKGGVKTIESYKTGEVIDCVDIFKQSAFDHSLLKNHTIQMKPSSNRKANGAGYVEGALSQAWWKYGECPEGTIPIRRPQNRTNRPFRRLSTHVKRFDQSQAEFVAPSGHEYAQVSLIDGNYMGARAIINVWNPTVRDQELSLSQIWLTSGPIESMNAMHAGWMVDSASKQTKTYIYWTSDGYQQTGCYNLECPGFIQTDNKIALGSPLQPISTYDGQQYEISIHITKNEYTGSWWLRIADVDVGYWPREIFTSLSGPADVITWGGEIINGEPDGQHTSTQMGSGHFPSEGIKKAALFRNLKFIDDEFIERDPENLVTYVTRPECYDLLLNESLSTTYGVKFFYGGPGFSDRCAK